MLIPVDTTGRVLELILLLDDFWDRNQLNSYKLVLFTSQAFNTLEYAKSHIEWMGDDVAKNFERSRDNAFHAKISTSFTTWKSSRR